MNVGAAYATPRAMTRACRLRALEIEALDHAGLNDPRMQRQQHQLRVETVARDQRRFDPALDGERKLDVVDAGKGVRPDHAIGDDFGRRPVDLRRRIIAVGLILEQRADRELHRLRHHLRMQVERAQRLVELPQIAGAAEDAHESDRRIAARHEM